MPIVYNVWLSLVLTFIELNVFALVRMLRTKVILRFLFSDSTQTYTYKQHRILRRITYFNQNTIAASKLFCIVDMWIFHRREEEEEKQKKNKVSEFRIVLSVSTRCTVVSWKVSRKYYNIAIRQKFFLVFFVLLLLSLIHFIFTVRQNALSFVNHFYSSASNVN